MTGRAVTFTVEDAAALMVGHARDQLGAGADQSWSFDVLFSPEGEISFVVTFDPSNAEEVEVLPPPAVPSPDQEPDVL